MYTFKTHGKDVLFHYTTDFGSNAWLRDDLKKGKVNLSSVFHFEPGDLINTPPDDDGIDGFTYELRFGSVEGDYVRIPGRRLGIDNDVLLAADIELKRKLFAAERNISVFGRLADLLTNTDPIVIGGTAKDSIPRTTFEELLNRFPNTYEMDRYADARVSTVLSQYIDGMKDARGRYEAYLNKRLTGNGVGKLDLDFIKSLEVEKYIIIRDLITDALKTKTNMAEKEWQKLMASFLLLLFPKYIKLLENVMIADFYSAPGVRRKRYIDIALVDANGNLDVIEIKKPFDDKILRKTRYRNNSIPTAELSGSIMQAEKYLFHLTKWGVKGEEELTKKYASSLPAGMQLRISNPKAIIIVGRDQIGDVGMTGDQLLDFEVIKRKYANMMDIITYDDLLRRLDHTIIALGAGLTATPPTSATASPAPPATSPAPQPPSPKPLRART